MVGLAFSSSSPAGLAFSSGRASLASGRPAGGLRNSGLVDEPHHASLRWLVRTSECTRMRRLPHTGCRDAHALTGYNRGYTSLRHIAATEGRCLGEQDEVRGARPAGLRSPVRLRHPAHLRAEPRQLLERELRAHLPDPEAAGRRGPGHARGPAPDGKPDRNVYTITDLGRDELHRWLAQPPEPDRGSASRCSSSSSTAGRSVPPR